MTKFIFEAKKIMILFLFEKKKRTHTQWKKLLPVFFFFFKHLNLVFKKEQVKATWLAKVLITEKKKKKKKKKISVQTPLI